MSLLAAAAAGLIAFASGDVSMVLPSKSPAPEPVVVSMPEQIIDAVGVEHARLMTLLAAERAAFAAEQAAFVVQQQHVHNAHSAQTAQLAAERACLKNDRAQLAADILKQQTVLVKTGTDISCYELISGAAIAAVLYSIKRLYDGYSVLKTENKVPVTTGAVYKKTRSLVAGDFRWVVNVMTAGLVFKNNKSVGKII